MILLLQYAVGPILGLKHTGESYSPNYDFPASQISSPYYVTLIHGRQVYKVSVYETCVVLHLFFW